MYAAICGFCGYLLSDKLGLIRSFRLEGNALKKSLLISSAAALLFSLDYWTFGAIYPEIQIADAAGLTLTSWIASILGGGIIEELMLRWFLMSLIAFLLWKIFFRKEQTAPTKALIIANIVAALLFAAGHIPANTLIFGELTPLILIRCFLLNGGAGLIFGYLFRKYGIQYAILSHMLFHVISKTVWTLFI
ncbi:MAG: CPBP family intramembrane metalloprotease [Firmicutes bacterium]|nr:CPBP family intramembrane metalloprotease [Bacillota bacterium]